MMCVDGGRDTGARAPRARTTTSRVRRAHMANASARIARARPRLAPSRARGDSIIVSPASDARRRSCDADGDRGDDEKVEERMLANARAETSRARDDARLARSRVTFEEEVLPRGERGRCWDI